MASDEEGEMADLEIVGQNTLKIVERMVEAC
jgi:hypothetical protein